MIPLEMVRKHLGSGLRHVLVAECAVHTQEASRRHADASHRFTERSPRYDIDSGVQALEDCLLLKRCKVRNTLKVSVLKAVNQGDGLQDLQAFMRRNRTKAQIGAGTKTEFSMGRLGTEMTRCQGHRLTLLIYIYSTDSMFFVKATIADLVLKEKRTTCLTTPLISVYFFLHAFRRRFRPSLFRGRRRSDQRNHSLKICQDSARSINVAKAEYCQALTELSQDDNG